MTTFLISGVSSYWGERVAARIAAEHPSLNSGMRLLGLDRKPPQTDIPGLDFVRAELGSPLLLDLLNAEKVETVLHFDASPDMQESTDKGHTTRLFLSQCAEAGARRILLKSSTAVYGARPANTFHVSEMHSLDLNLSHAPRAMAELDSFANGLAAQYPDLTLTVLRFAHILGPTADTALARFLLNDRMPTLLGFNPLFQLIHEEDVIAALSHAALNDLPGIYNIAAEDTLPLNKILALAGKLPLPIAHPLAPTLPARLTPLPIEYLRYSCLANLERMQNDFGLAPSHTAEETVTEFAAQVRHTRYMPDALEAIINPLRTLVQRLTRTGGEEDGDND